MLHVLARIVFKPEHAAQGSAIMVKLATATRQESGCVAYDVFQRPDAPHIFQTVEQWRDQASMEAHMTAPYIIEAITTLGPMFEGPPEILPFNKLL